MLKREISGLAVAEGVIAVLLIVMIAGFVRSGGAEPGTFAFAAGTAALALVAAHNLRRRRRAERSAAHEHDDENQG